MPIYEYQCRACGHHLEAIQKFSDEPLKECPECLKPELQKLVSSSAFHLKGGGWYVTDIRDKDKPKPKAAEEGSKTSGGETPAASTDKSSGGSSSNSTDSAAG